MTEKEIDLKSLQTNDIFIDTVLKATQAAIRTNQQEKKKALLNAVLNAALPNPPEKGAGVVGHRPQMGELPAGVVGAEHPQLQRLFGQQVYALAS